LWKQTDDRGHRRGGCRAELGQQTAHRAAHPSIGVIESLGQDRDNRRRDGARLDQLSRIVLSALDQRARTQIRIQGALGVTQLKLAAQEKEIHPPQPRTTEARPQLTPEQLQDVGRMAQAESAALLAALFAPAVPKLDPAEVAGLAAGTKPAVLTLEQAYSLTMIRAHSCRRTR